MLVVPVLAAGWVLLAVFLQLIRQRGVEATDTLWAEDGRVFLGDAIDEPITSIGRHYAGYMQLLPRLLGALAATLPLRYAALIFAGSSAFVISLVSLYLFFATKSILNSPLSRGLLSAFVAFSPAAHETSNNGANLHWYLFFACFWALLHIPESRVQSLSSSAVIFAATTSNPLTLLLSPLLIRRFRYAGAKWRSSTLGAYLAGMTLQGIVVLGDLSSAGLTPESGLITRYNASHPADLPALFGLGVVGPLFIGESYIGDVWDMFRWGFPYASLVLLTLLCVYAAIRRHSWRSGFGLTLLLYGIISFVLPVLIRGTDAIDEVDQGIYLVGARYVVLPMFFLFAAMLLLVDLPDPPPGSSGLRRVRAGIAAWAVLIIGLNFFFYNARSPGPRWSRELNHASTTCRTTAQHKLTVRTTPPGWYVEMRCKELE